MTHTVFGPTDEGEGSALHPQVAETGAETDVEHPRQVCA